MPNLQDMIKQAKAQLDRNAEDLKLWESYDAVTVTDEKGKVVNLRTQMIAQCMYNRHKYTEVIAALEKRAEKSN
jgi:hypothetical protein